MTRRKPTKYVPPTPPATAPQAGSQAPKRPDPLAFLDELPPVLTVEEAAGVLRREPRAYLEDPKSPRFPVNKREFRVLREMLRAYLEERIDGSYAAFLATVKACPRLLDAEALAGLLRVSVADAGAWAAEVRGGAAD